MNDSSFFIISGLYQYQDINTILLQAKTNFPKKFLPNRIIRGVYGNFPNTIWNGEDMLFSPETLLMPQIIDILSHYNRMGLQIYLNCTNSEITEKQCFDTYCNLILKHTLENNFFNACVVNSPFLSEYLSKKYPELLHIIVGKNNEIDTECAKNINFPFFLNPQNNNNFEQLKLYPNKNNIYITLNPYCISCPIQKTCLYKENIAQLTYDNVAAKQYSCSTIKNIKHHELEYFISSEQINDYIQKGYRHFVIEQMPTYQKQIDEYLYYFIKPEYHTEIKDYFYESKEKIQ